MVRIFVSILVISLISSMIFEGTAKKSSNRAYEESGTFEDYPNMIGNWERAADAEGPLEVDVLRKVYIDLDQEEDVYNCSCNFNSYAEDPMFAGNYWVSATIHGVGTNHHGNGFNGPWWDYEANGHREPQADDTPQDINLTSSFSWAFGTQPQPPEPDDNESGDQPEPPTPQSYSVYAHVPF